MAKEWYLLNAPYNQLSGYESESILEYAEESVLEILESEIAETVELCNYDLSECIQIRAIIQNSVQDTKLKTLTRQMLVPIGTCHAGMYVKYKNRYWLITGIVDDNHMYEKAVLSFCNWLLSWVNDKGEIVQRWANITSASQYNNGETGMKYYIVRSDQLMIFIPNDDESLLLPDGKRFIIDKRCAVYEKEMGESLKTDLSFKLRSYQLTRADTVLYNYETDGHMSFMVTQDEQHDTDGFYVVDDKGYWLCETPLINKTCTLSCNIECDEQIIYDGIEPTIFKAIFYDENGEKVEIQPQWNIKCDFLDELEITYVGNYISISTNNPKLINKSFELFLNSDGYEQTSINVYIQAFI